MLMRNHSTFRMSLIAAGILMLGVPLGLVFADVSTAPTIPDAEVARLHAGCMTGPLRGSDYPDSVQKEYCDCYAEGAVETLTSEQIRVVAVTFENGPAGLDVEFGDMSRSQATALSKRMNAIHSIDQRCHKRLYDAVLAHRSTQNADSVRNDPRVTALYDGCVVGDTTRKKSPMHVQLAYCECYAREAVEHLHATDIRILTAGLTNGKAALEAHISRMLTGEMRGFTKRMERFGKAAPQKCLKAGIEATGNG